MELFSIKKETCTFQFPQIYYTSIQNVFFFCCNILQDLEFNVKAFDYRTHDLLSNSLNTFQDSFFVPSSHIFVCYWYFFSPRFVFCFQISLIFLRFCFWGLIFFMSCFCFWTGVPQWERCYHLGHDRWNTV